MNEDILMEKESCMLQMQGTTPGTEEYEKSARAFKDLTDAETALKKVEIEEAKLEEEKKFRLWTFLGKLGVGILMLGFGIVSELFKDKGISLKSNEIWNSAKDAVKRF